MHFLVAGTNKKQIFTKTYRHLVSDRQLSRSLIHFSKVLIAVINDIQLLLGNSGDLIQVLYQDIKTNRYPYRCPKEQIINYFLSAGLVIRKITFNRTIQKIMFFCIAVGFLLSVCCYVKLIKHLFFTLLLLFGLSFSLIYVKRAMTVKHLLTKVKAFSFRSTATLSYCLDRQMLITSMKLIRSFKCYDQLSLHISCFNTCRLLYNKLRIGINISALAIMTLSIRRITLGYAIYLSNIKVSELGVTCIKYQCVMFTYLG